MKNKRSFKKLPAFGIWLNRPQTDIEMEEVKERIALWEITLKGYTYYSEGTTTYGLCLNV